MRYKNVLVICDNDRLIQGFKDICAETKADAQFVFAKTILSRRIDYSLASEYLDLKDLTTIADILTRYDLVFSLHCKQLFPQKLVENVKCINIHPGYNPINRGWFPQVFAIIHNLDIGATIHEIDNELDHGPIIDREKVKAEEWDTSSSLYNKILEKELELLRRNLPNILANRYKPFIPEDEGNLFLKKDFEQLKSIDLDQKMTFKDFLNYLRAMSFEGYDNCYFISKDNRKIFVSIQLKPEPLKIQGHSD